MSNKLDTKIEQCEADIQKLQDNLKDLKKQKDRENIKLYSGMRFHTDCSKNVLFSDGKGEWFVAGRSYTESDKIEFAEWNTKEVFDNFKNGAWIKD